MQVEAENRCLTAVAAAAVAYGLGGSEDTTNRTLDPPLPEALAKFAGGG